MGSPISKKKRKFHLKVEKFQISTYRYPRTQQRSARRPSRSQRKAGACSWPYQREPACRRDFRQHFHLQMTFKLCGFGVLDNVRTDGRRENGGQGLGGPGGLALSCGDRDGRTRRHCCRSMSMVRLKTKCFPVGAHLWIFSLTELRVRDCGKP